MFDPEIVEQDTVIEKAKRIVHEISNSRSSQLTRSIRQIPSPSTWKLPDPQWCKINTDGVRKTNTGEAACGGTCPALAAELWGIFKGPWDAGEKLDAIETDSSEAVKLLQEEDTDGRPLTILQHIAELRERDWTTTLTHIPREINGAIDVMATQAWTLHDNLHRFTQAPNTIRSILEADRISSLY
ncbi:uncharacterized protein LOC120129790 [Hibiscus syriacus]|uniref:uncharacterized protein LOC120129790 n=1 Tax=Hibiscus syriacus TaxID=106335 RepID=UPI001924CF01|nr:uncharacterized protein LOC120129790 [Hibiscus syriacus]